MARRIFLRDLGRGTVAAAVVGFGFVACSDDDPEAEATATESATTEGTSAPTGTATSAGGAAATATSTEAPAASEPAEAAAVRWERVNLGFVSAYVLVRGGEAAIVDTGVSGSADDIEASLSVVGVGWADVGHVIVTHSHGDHAGSLVEVMTRAADAMGYAGAADIPAITSPRELVAVGDGDRIFDLEIIATPGHTAGHISVLDTVGRLLVVGDAINGGSTAGLDGGVVGPNPQFSPDMATANLSVAKIAGLDFDTVLFGHGEPVIGGASAEVAALL
jgi:glyoxylase-like metal-dependent hydrolase (beta-lactamase superfamily II)